MCSPTQSQGGLSSCASRGLSHHPADNVPMTMLLRRAAVKGPSCGEGTDFSAVEGNAGHIYDLTLLRTPCPALHQGRLPDEVR